MHHLLYERVVISNCIMPIIWNPISHSDLNVTWKMGNVTGCLNGWNYNKDPRPKVSFTVHYSIVPYYAYWITKSEHLFWICFFWIRFVTHESSTNPMLYIKLLLSWKTVTVSWSADLQHQLKLQFIKDQKR